MDIPNEICAKIAQYVNQTKYMWSTHTVNQRDERSMQIIFRVNIIDTKNNVSIRKKHCVILHDLNDNIVQLMIDKLLNHDKLDSMSFKYNKGIIVFQKHLDQYNFDKKLLLKALKSFL